jgi:hypothetical protein
MKRCLAKPVPNVNNNFEVFYRIEPQPHRPSVFKTDFTVRRNDIISAFTFLKRFTSPEDLHFPSEEPERLAVCWQSWLVPSIGNFESSRSDPAISGVLKERCRCGVCDVKPAWI